MTREGETPFSLDDIVTARAEAAGQDAAQVRKQVEYLYHTVGAYRKAVDEFIAEAVGVAAKSRPALLTAYDLIMRSAADDGHLDLNTLGRTWEPDGDQSPIDPRDAGAMQDLWTLPLPPEEASAAVKAEYHAVWQYASPATRSLWMNMRPAAAAADVMTAALARVYGDPKPAAAPPQAPPRRPWWKFWG